MTKILARVTGVFVTVVGAVGLAAPSTLLSIGEALTTSVGLYAVAVLRIVIGIVLLKAAPVSRAPGILRVLGIIAVSAGLATALVGVNGARAMLAWEAAQGPTLVRVGAGVAVIFGGLIAFAVSDRRAV